MKYTKNYSEILIDIITENNVDFPSDEIIKKMSEEIWISYKDKTNIKYLYDSIKKNDLLYEKFEKVIKYYYFWCKLPIKKLSLEHLFMSIYSIMEYIMTDTEYIEFNNYLFKILNKREKYTKKDIDIIFQEWINIHGSRKKVLNYLTNYFDQEKFLQLVEKWDEKEDNFKYFNTIDEVSKFFDKLRNEVIHNIGTVNFLTRREQVLLNVEAKSMSLKDAFYKLTITKEDFIEEFEKSLYKYFYNQVEKLSKNK